jgi:hypothetical protein
MIGSEIRISATKKIEQGQRRKPACSGSITLRSLRGDQMTRSRESLEVENTAGVMAL